MTQDQEATINGEYVPTDEDFEAVFGDTQPDPFPMTVAEEAQALADWLTEQLDKAVLVLAETTKEADKAYDRWLRVADKVDAAKKHEKHARQAALRAQNTATVIRAAIQRE